MVKVDLITGFLGSGKTTWIKKYVDYLIDKGENVCVLENDFGAINVDTMILADHFKDRADIEMVAGGCDHDCHIRRFKTKLISMAMLGYNRVVVEPSGLFDVDEFFDILHEEPLDRWYSINSVMAIVDKDIYKEELSAQSEYIFASQIAQASKLIVSKLDEIDEIEEVTNKLLDYVNKALASISSKKLVERRQCLVKSWDLLDNEDFKELDGLLLELSDFEKSYRIDDLTYQPLFFMNLEMSRQDLERKIADIFANPSCGRVYRIKGYVKEEDHYIELNARPDTCRISQSPIGQEVLILIGEDMRADQIESILAGSNDEDGSEDGIEDGSYDDSKGCIKDCSKAGSKNEGETC